MESQEPASRSMGQPEKGYFWSFHLRKNDNDDGDDNGDNGDDSGDNDCICNDLLL